jgi:hypothetical protein
MNESAFYHSQRLGFRLNPFSVLDAEERKAITILHSSIEPIIQAKSSHMQVMGETGTRLIKC